jgi:putative glutamine amidotransferase
VRPPIGIPPVLDDRGALRPGRPTSWLDLRYASALEEAGASVVCLPAQRDADALAARLDGLLIPGGGDFAPQRSYPPGVEFELVSPAQLEFDARLLACARARRLPVLGICYGMQLLAHASGGRLHHDLPSDLPAAAPHRLREPDGRHALRIERGSRLAGLLGDDGVAVNSRHHQAVAEPGAGLRVVARAEDGVVEALEAEGDAFCLGLQWHPERMDAAHRARVFGAFVGACARV